MGVRAATLPLERIARPMPPRLVVVVDLAVDRGGLGGREVEDLLQHARQLDVLVVFGVAVHLEAE